MRITKVNRFWIIFLLIAFSFQAFSIYKLDKRLSAVENKVNLRTCPAPNEFSLNNLSLINPEITKAVIMVESSGNKNAYNKHTGAVGLLQLTPLIYKNLCGLTKKEAFEPERNIACGSLFLHTLLNKYKGNLEKALLHYNSGYAKNNYRYIEKVKTYVKKDVFKQSLRVLIKARKRREEGKKILDKRR